MRILLLIETSLCLNSLTRVTYIVIFRDKKENRSICLEQVQGFSASCEAFLKLFTVTDLAPATYLRDTGRFFLYRSLEMVMEWTKGQSFSASIAKRGKNMMLIRNLLLLDHSFISLQIIFRFFKNNFLIVSLLLILGSIKKRARFNHLHQPLQSSTSLLGMYSH